MTVEMILGILLAGLLSENYAILHFLGTGAVIENERSVKHSLIIGLGTTIVMVVSTAITWPLQAYVLESVPYLRTLVFVVVVLLVVEAIHLLAGTGLEGLCRVDFTKFAINGAVLGLCIHNTEIPYGEAVLTAAAVGIGFTLTMAVFPSIREKADDTAAPKAFRGFPLTLLCAGMLALTLLSYG